MFTSYITDSLLYFCFSVVMGSLLIKIVPETKKPTVVVPYWLLQGCVVSIVLLSYVPVYKITKFYQGALETDFWTVFNDVLFHVNVGNAWICTFALSISIFALLSIKSFQKNKATTYAAFFLLLGLICAFSSTSHSSSEYGWIGFSIHFVHFLAVIVWLGILFIVGWFSKDRNHWTSFLKWFSPLAVVCVVITIAAGIALMLYLVPDYLNSWMVPFGQALLIKHLLILPLLVFGFINGFLMKKRLDSDPMYDFSPWLKGESVLALLVFAATAVMGQQTPPPEASSHLKEEKLSQLFTTFYQGTFSQNMKVHLAASPTGLLFAVLAVFFLVLVFVSFKKRQHVITLIGLSFCFVVITYIAIMKSIV
jgi:putative copper resistance protein D